MLLHRTPRWFCIPYIHLDSQGSSTTASLFSCWPYLSTACPSGHWTASSFHFFLLILTVVNPDLSLLTIFLTHRNHSFVNWYLLNPYHNQAMAFQVKKLQEIVEDPGTWYVAIHGVAKSQIQLSDWTTTLMANITWKGMSGRENHQSKSQNNKVHERNNVHLGKTSAKVSRKFTSEGLAP